MWKVYALLSALFAAMTAIFAKVGVKDINSNLATAIRTTVILFITWGIVLFGSHISDIKDIPRHSWLFLVLSGAATGLSWLFYFKALQTGDVSRVAPIDKLSVVITICLSFLFPVPERAGLSESHHGRTAGNMRKHLDADKVNIIKWRLLQYSQTSLSVLNFAQNKLRFREEKPHFRQTNRSI